MSVSTLSMQAYSVDELSTADLGADERHIEHHIIMRRASSLASIRRSDGGLAEITEAGVVLRQQAVDKVDRRSTQQLHQSVLHTYTHTTSES